MIRLRPYKKCDAEAIAEWVKDEDEVTIGVYENNDIAHECYKKVGFVDREIVEKEPWNVIEMEINA